MSNATFFAGVTAKRWSRFPAALRHLAETTRVDCDISRRRSGFLHAEYDVLVIGLPERVAAFADEWPNLLLVTGSKVPWIVGRAAFAKRTTPVRLHR